MYKNIIMSCASLAFSFVAKMQNFASKTNTETDSLVFKVHLNLANKKKKLMKFFWTFQLPKVRKKGKVAKWGAVFSFFLGEILQLGKKNQKMKKFEIK